MRAEIGFALLRASVLFLGLLAAGCGGGRTARVEGQVVWEDGKPAKELSGYQVESSVPGGKSSARGDIDAEGHFVLSTFEPGDGAEPGTHKVVISPVPRAEFEPAPKVKLPSRYAKPETSGLSFLVERGKKNEVTLTVSRK